MQILLSHIKTLESDKNLGSIQSLLGHTDKREVNLIMVRCWSLVVTEHLKNEVFYTAGVKEC